MPCRKIVVLLHPISKELERSRVNFGIGISREKRNTVGVLAQLARALAWHARGHRFDSDILHKKRVATNGPFLIDHGVVAHLVEHLVRNQKVVGSSPIYSTKKKRAKALFFLWQMVQKVGVRSTSSRAIAVGRADGIPRGSSTPQKKGTHARLWCKSGFEHKITLEEALPATARRALSIAITKN